MKKAHLLIFLSFWILLFASPALAGAPAVKLVIKDLQTGADVEITEPALLGFFALFDFDKPLAEVPQVTDGIEIIRYWDTGPFDHMHYYFGMDGRPSYVYYDGGLGSDSENKWYPANPDADQRLRTILGKQNVDRTDRLTRGIVFVGAAVGLLCLFGLTLYLFQRRSLRG